MARDDLVSVLRVACTHDDAVDWARVDCREYSGTETMPGDRDPTRIVSVPGRSITWFHLRPINAGTIAVYIDAAITRELRYARAFEAAVDAIEALEQPGTTWRPRNITTDAMGQQIPCMDAVELERVRVTLGMPWIYEVGRVAYQRACEGNTRGGGVKYTLPPTSLVALSLNDRLRADWLRTQQEANSSQPASNAPTPSDTQSV